MTAGSQPSSPPFRLIVLMPVFEDWQVAGLRAPRPGARQATGRRVDGPPNVMS
jgi:hypothetical protein